MCKNSNLLNLPYNNLEIHCLNRTKKSYVHVLFLQNAIKKVLNCVKLKFIKKYGFFWK